MLRATSILCVWLATVLLLSCTDHQVPAPVNPHIEIDTDWFDEESEDYVSLKVNFIQLGNKPIKSYGLVMVKGGYDDDLTPTFNDTVIPFQNPPVAGINVQSYPYNNFFSPNSVDPFGLFFRAFAELEDGTVVYGSSVYSLVYGGPL